MKTLYQVIIDWSEPDQGYLAKVPDLAGCMAFGETRKKALYEVELAIENWLDTARALGRKIPIATYEQRGNN